MSAPSQPQDQNPAPRPADGPTGLAAVLLAAGMSSRMRQLKPLLPFGGSTVLERAARTFLDAGIHDLTAVLGHQADRLRPVLDRLGVRCVVNPDYERGMYSSVVAGISSLTPGVEGVFVLPADMPAVRSRTVELLARVFRGAGASVVYPMFGGQRGHPPLLSRRIFRAVVAGSGEGGLRAVLERFDEEACAVRVLDEGVVLDLDTRTEYQAARAELGDRTLPSLRECQELLAELEVAGPVVNHGRAVAAIGRRVALELVRAGVPLDARLVETAGLLHDLAKGKPDHAGEAARLLASVGFPRLAEVVGAHTDLPAGAGGRLDEAALVYLADKLVSGVRPAPLAERFEAAAQRFSGSPAALAAVARRREDAESIAARVDGVLGPGALARLAGVPGPGRARRARVHA